MKIFLLLANSYVLLVYPINAYSFLNALAIVILVVSIAFSHESSN